MLASIQGGRFLDGADSVTHEEDYMDKSLALLREMERELSESNQELKSVMLAINDLLETNGGLIEGEHTTDGTEYEYVMVLRSKFDALLGASLHKITGESNE